ncbi:class I SAM-dependent methyltransferase [Virgisporangium ochraceum]|uniref:class I SAM-dependent methyltransferase n=1 Tax=Virgisporangium ochraceum TaxID=65505 RepID=UPI0019431FCC|nr:SAM-dependent methyltransferase [Virgisporangium ochraceum]
MLNRTSRTAQHVTLFRAIETARRRDRVIDDPYAVTFLTGRYGLLARAARVPAARRGLERYLDRRFPGGPRASAVVRTRLIDGLVEDSLAAGAGQVVLLGAGYDSRAYRLAAARSVRVFEVDHPATQVTKRGLVEARVPVERRAHVRFVPVDLLRDDLAAALLAAGFEGAGGPAAGDRGRGEQGAGDRGFGGRAVVVWEGVTNYLTAEAVDTTLRRLAGVLVSGSHVVFTYVDRAALDGTGDFQGVWQDAVRRHGEPWTFGLDPAVLPAYLDERGMDLTLDLSTRDAADRYLVPLGRAEPAAPFYRIARAEVR